jgi:Tol biopolymer transport system component
MSRVRLSLSLVALALTLIMLVVPSRAASPDRNGRLMVLTVAGSGNTDRRLVTLNSDGTGVRTRSVEHFAADFAVSPDGRRLAYDNGNGIFVSDLNGRHRRRIAADGDLPSWSPDGRLIAYRGGTQQGNMGFPIYLVSSHGGPSRRVRGAVGSIPKWSPDGSSIAFTRGLSRTSQRSELALVSARGGRARSLYRPRYAYGSVDSFDWSPDGRRIVMRVNVQQPDCEGCSPQEVQPPPTPSESKYDGIDVIRSDGSGIRRLIQYGNSPVWSPDGRQLAYVCGESSPRGQLGVCVIGSRGGRPHQIFTTPVQLWPPLNWIP